MFSIYNFKYYKPRPRLEQDFQIIEEIKGTEIFTKSQLSDYFISNIKINKSKIVIPIIINHNHFIIALADLNQKTFCCLNLYGSSEISTELYLEKFKNFICAYDDYYKTQLNSIKLRSYTHKHLLQQDDYNCGPLIIYFFEKICRGSSLETPCNLSEYRNVLKEIKLTKAPDMSEKCLFCTRNFVICDFYRCSSCNRYRHQRCCTLQNHSCFVNNIVIIYAECINSNLTKLLVITSTIFTMKLLNTSYLQIGENF